LALEPARGACQSGPANRERANVTARHIYKIATGEQWAAAEKAGRFDGAPVDLADGYIHFSTREQVGETAAKHFAGQDGLVLAEIDTVRLDPAALRHEPSRGGQLFPHLYAPLPMAAVIRTWRLALDSGGTHVFPRDLLA